MADSDIQPTRSPSPRLRFIEAALEAAKAGVIVVERDGRIAFANDDGRALLAEGAFSALDGRRVAARELPQARVLETGHAEAQVLVHEGHDGERDVILSEAKPIRDEAGAVVGAVATFVDAVPQDLARVFDGAPVGVAVLRGPELVFEYVNEAFQAIAPGTPMLGHSFGNASWELPEVVDRLRQVWETGETWRANDLPLYIERTPGDPLDTAWFSFVCQKVRRLHPPDALLGFVVETTERVRMREGLARALDSARRRASELEAVIDTMLEGVVAYDCDRRVTLVNATARRMLERVGVRPPLLEDVAELMRTLRLEHVDGRPLQPDELPVRRALAGEAGRINIRFWNPVAQRHGYATIGGAPIRGAKGDILGVVSVGSDVTIETELDRLKDEFIRVIAHELKTPIAIVKAYTQSLAQTLGPSLAPAHARMLQAIERGAERINRIMCELLEAQQIDLGTLTLVLQPVDLRELVEGVVHRVAAAAPHHRLRFTALHPIAMRADAERLREVTRILLDNAIRYSPSGGDIEVVVAVVGGEACLSIRDHGVGIPPDRRDRLFQRFYRAHTGTPNDYGGTGLGLYVARQIIERHGGTIVYEPAEGGGSIFTLRLPTSAAREAILGE